MTELLALLQVIMIDVSLSGDNAIIIAMAAAGLPDKQRGRAIALGITAAIILRAVFAVGAVYLLNVPYIMPIGGVLLLWVCWKLFRDLRAAEDAAEDHVPAERKTLFQAVVQITLADVSMSLDNVLAVAGAAREHIWVMVVGLVVAIGFMAVAANVVVGLLRRWPWLNWLGLGLILYVAVRMIWEGIL